MGSVVESAVGPIRVVVRDVRCHKPHFVEPEAGWAVVGVELLQTGHLLRVAGDLLDPTVL